jgi:RNA polymerase sigma-70 factor (ECF subfamily)
MFFYVRRFVANEEDAWDALQNVWVKAFKGLGGLRETNRFRVWLYSIAHKTAMSQMRETYREREVLDEQAPPEIAEDLNEHPRPEDAERIHAALGLLEIPFREVLTLHFLDELSVQEVAQVIGVPVGTVKSRLHYARQALKKILEREQKHEQVTTNISRPTFGR